MATARSAGTAKQWNRGLSRPNGNLAGATMTLKGRRYDHYFFDLRLRSTMDSIWVSGTQDLGSIPSGATDKHKYTQANAWVFYLHGGCQKLAFVSTSGK